VTQKAPKIGNLDTIAQLRWAISSQPRHISTFGKMLNSNISSTCPHNMVNFGLLMAEIGLAVWSTPANFNGFCVLASLLQRRRSTEANQTLHGVWPSPELVHYIYISGALVRNGILSGAKFTLRASLALSYICSVTARQSSRGRQPNFAALSRGRHRYSAGRPSRWAMAHILVLSFFPRLF